MIDYLSEIILVFVTKSSKTEGLGQQCSHVFSCIHANNEGKHNLGLPYPCTTLFDKRPWTTMCLCTLGDTVLCKEVVTVCISSISQLQRITPCQIPFWFYILQETYRERKEGPVILYQARSIHRTRNMMPQTIF